MSSLLYALGKLCYRRWLLVMGMWLGVLAITGAAALALGNGPKDVFRIPGAESMDAFQTLQHTFPEIAGANGQMLVLAEDGGDVTAPEHREAILAMVTDLKGVDQTVMILDPWDELLNTRDTISPDKSAAIINFQMNTSVEQILPSTQRQLEALAEEHTTEDLHFLAGGGAYGPQPPKIGISEGIGVAVALLVLAFTFGSMVAAGLPLISAGAGIGVAMAVVWIATKWLTITTTAPFLALMVGLAVGIDYSLFVLARYRDELAKGVEPEEATGRAVATAGSAVVFAGVTVMIALVGLLVTTIPFLAFMGIAAAIAVFTAVVASLTLVPAMFGLLKGRLIPKPPKVKKPKKSGKERHTLASLWVGAATKYPIVTIVVVGAGLVALALPALHLRLALPDNGTAHHGATQREVYEKIGEKFGVGYNSQIVMTGDIVQSREPFELIDEIKAEIMGLDNVCSIPIATPNPPDGDTMVIQVTPCTGATDQETFQLVDDLRALAQDLGVKYAEFQLDPQVTGMTAAAVDIAVKLQWAVLPFGILVIGLSLILLTMVFRSIAVPIKATVGYLLSVAASFGVVTAVFQDGFMAEQLNVVSVGPIVCFLPILLMGLLFGLAMDYEVFLVSRMREEYVHGNDAHAAIKTGFTASYKVVMAAALIMIAVFAAFEPHGDSVTQPIAFALAVGVFIDAFLVRMTFVPAVMALLGDKAWWMPQWLDKRLPAFDVEGEGVNHQLELTDWPYIGAHHGIHADRIKLADREGVALYGPVSFEVAPSEVTLVRGLTSTARTALALTIGGRVNLTEGKLKVANFVVPQQMLMMRSSVSVIRLNDEEDPVTAVREALNSKTKVLVVDGLDTVASAEDKDVVLAEIREHAHTSGVAALVTLSRETLEGLGVSDPSIRVLDLQTSRVTPLGAPVTEGAPA
ncbi:MAG TPA: MMPL family transporter [Nocardioidaceae bacterium]|nr:MMPL family transporter [Nocardioidaceae bacterium]